MWTGGRSRRTRGRSSINERAGCERKGALQWTSNMLYDLRHAVRGLLWAPAYAIVAVLTLALGIGATTAIFSVVNAVLLRPLPFTEPDRLLTTRGSLADLRDLQAATRSFEDIAFWASNQFNLRLDGDSRQVLGGQITRNLLPLLGVQPLLGRNFTEADDRQDT